MAYRYVKKYPKSINTSRLKFSLLIPVIFVFIGSGLILSVLFPILSYQFYLSPQVSALVDPSVSKTVLGKSSNSDYSSVSNWFSKVPRLPPLPSKITHYTISIPKMKINQAIVQIGGDDLKKSLIHYQGTAFPGQLGNAVIFGHSALPQFFGPQNYLAIFAYLPKIQNNDEILVEFDGITYKYLVEKIIEVPPEDISILEQNYSDSYLTLVTCVPPGTTFHRLVVKAKITKI
jgi:sortase A